MARGKSSKRSHPAAAVEDDTEQCQQENGDDQGAEEEAVAAHRVYAATSPVTTASPRVCRDVARKTIRSPVTGFWIVSPG
jgi:hypothetical protein